MMNNVIAKNTTEIMSKELISFINQTGKSGCVLIGVCYIAYLIHDLGVRAIDGDCPMDFTANHDGITFKLGKLQTAE